MKGLFLSVAIFCILMGKCASQNLFQYREYIYFINKKILNILLTSNVIRGRGEKGIKILLNKALTENTPVPFKELVQKVVPIPTSYAQSPKNIIKIIILKCFLMPPVPKYNLCSLKICHIILCCTEINVFPSCSQNSCGALKFHEQKSQNNISPRSTKIKFSRTV